MIAKHTQKTTTKKSIICVRVLEMIQITLYSSILQRFSSRFEKKKHWNNTHIGLWLNEWNHWHTHHRWLQWLSCCRIEWPCLLDGMQSYAVVWANNKLVSSIFAIENCVSTTSLTYFSLHTHRIHCDHRLHFFFSRVAIAWQFHYYGCMCMTAAVCFDTLSVHLTYHYGLMWLRSAHSLSTRFKMWYCLYSLHPRWNSNDSVNIVNWLHAISFHLQKKTQKHVSTVLFVCPLAHSYSRSISFTIFLSLFLSFLSGTLSLLWKWFKLVWLFGVRERLFKYKCAQASKQASVRAYISDAVSVRL